MAATWFLVVVVAGLSMVHANEAEPDSAKREPRPFIPAALKEAIGSVNSVDKRIMHMKRQPKRLPIADDLQNIIRQPLTNYRIALNRVEYMPDAQNLVQHKIQPRSLEASEPLDRETGMQQKKKGNKSR